MQYPKGHPYHIDEQELTPQIKVELRKAEGRKRSSIAAFKATVITSIVMGAIGLATRAYELNHIEKKEGMMCLKKQDIDAAFKVMADKLKSQYLTTAISCEQSLHYQRQIWANTTQCESKK